MKFSYCTLWSICQFRILKNVDNSCLGLYESMAEISPSHSLEVSLLGIWLPAMSSGECQFTCLFLRFFWCGPFLKSLLNLLQYYFCYIYIYIGVFFGCEAYGNRSFENKDQIHTCCIGRWSLNHWTSFSYLLILIILSFILSNPVTTPGKSVGYRQNCLRAWKHLYKCDA